VIETSISSLKPGAFPVQVPSAIFSVLPQLKKIAQHEAIKKIIVAIICDYFINPPTNYEKLVKELSYIFANF